MIAPAVRATESTAPAICRTFAARSLVVFNMEPRPAGVSPPMDLRVGLRILYAGTRDLVNSVVGILEGRGNEVAEVIESLSWGDHPASYRLGWVAVGRRWFGRSHDWWAVRHRREHLAGVPRPGPPGTP